MLRPARGLVVRGLGRRAAAARPLATIAARPAWLAAPAPPEAATACSARRPAAGARRLSSRAKRDYYDVLGVGRAADAGDVKKAYRKLAKKYHPDTSSDDDATRKFQEASEAYETLSDAGKRSAYDAYGHAAADMGGGGGGGGGGDPFDAFRSAFGGQQQRGGFQGGGRGEPFEDILNEFFGGGGQRRRSGPRRGADLQLAVRLSFMEAARGVQGKTLEWQDVGPDGRRGDRKSVDVDVPAGVDTGMQIRLGGRGGGGDRGAPAGDLFVSIEVEPDPYFERDGADVYGVCVWVRRRALVKYLQNPRTESTNWHLPQPLRRIPLSAARNHTPPAISDVPTTVVGDGHGDPIGAVVTTKFHATSTRSV